MAGNENLRAHEATYSGLIAMLKYGGVAVFVIVCLVIWIIT